MDKEKQHINSNLISGVGYYQITGDEEGIDKYIKTCKHAKTVRPRPKYAMPRKKREDLSSNAILMCLLVVLAIGLGSAIIVTEPTKICSACRISQAGLV